MVKTPDITLGVVRGISYGLFGAPDRFLPQMRALGCRLARVYLTWNQLAPEPGRYDWSALDALLEQVEPGDEIWLTVVSSSRWATKIATDFLPASPARDNANYELFLGALVARAAGRIRYWQCNNEPSNPGLWSGSAEDYAEQANIFAKVVHRLDRAAEVVLGGCGYDVLLSKPGSEPRKFFHTVLDRARPAFDLFAVHLYDDPSRIAEHVAEVRMMMLDHGYEREVVAGEYGGPTLLEFPALEPVMHQVMAEAFAGGGPSLDSADLAKQGETPDRRAMRTLYEKMGKLPRELQMFMQGCPPALEARRDRIACREMVTRNLLALAAGIRMTLCWNLGPEVPNYRDPYNMMGFLSDKLALMDFGGKGTLSKRKPAADALARLATALEGMNGIRQLEMPPGLIGIEIARERGALDVFWAAGDPFAGEDEPPQLLDWPWPHETVNATDAFGAARPLFIKNGRLSLGLSVTPLFIEA
ncbi:MAG TPA: hypothetical protein VG757_00325 [Devosia sp.]|nr:hypothetical protein [Devosia sp.]